MMPHPATLVLVQGAGNLALLAAIIIPGGFGSYEMVFVAALTAGGGMGLAETSWLLIVVRIIHFTGLGAASFFFAAWARILLSEPVVEAVERRTLELDEPPAP